jgi:hypothetical protein
MNWKKIKEKFISGFTVADTISERGRDILHDDLDAGYKIVEAAITSRKGINDKRVISKNLNLADRYYDLIEA